MKNVRQRPLPALLVTLARPVPHLARPQRCYLVVAGTDAIQRRVPTEAPRERLLCPLNPAEAITSITCGDDISASVAGLHVYLATLLPKL